MISSHSIQHLPSKSFMTARLTKCSIQWYASPLQFVRYRGWVWERVESNAGQFASFRFSPRPSLLSSDHGWVCRVLIKIVTRLRGEVTRLSRCLIWHPDNTDILQWKTKEALCRAAMCHPPPAGPWLTVIIVHREIAKISYLFKSDAFLLRLDLNLPLCNSQKPFTSKLIVWWHWIIVLVSWFKSVSLMIGN